MKKIFNFIKKYNYIIFTVLISMSIISIIYYLQKVSPFGRNSLLTVDFFHQYGPMLAELYDRLHKSSNIIYSFNTGLGLPIFRNFFNYLSSPINIIMFLFKRKNLLTSYSIIIAFKTMLSSITCMIYLTKKFNTKKKELITISILYAFSAYFTAYYWNIMWLDGLYIIPLITLGIENIINNKSGILYTISLTYILFTNYFIAYMLCIYSCIYFISYLIIKTDKFDIKKIFNTCLKFTICSLISGLLNAAELIPMFEALKSTNATMGSVPTSQYYSFTILEFIKNHLTGVTSTVFASDISNAPNVSCGILSIALLILFYLNNKITLKRKIVYTSILIFLLMSFYIAPLDYVWHAFHVPNDLPYRYSFIYSFILIIICGYSLKNIKDISFKKILLSYGICMIFITYVLITKFDNIESNMLTINYLLISTYFLIYCLYIYYPKYKNIAIYGFIFVCALECIVSVNHNWDILQYIDEFYSDYNDIHSSINILKKKDDELFYRTEKNKILTYNDGAWYNYYGLSTFSSMAYNNVAKLNNDLGQPGNQINSYYYKQNTPIYDMMFDIKYTIGDNLDNKRYNLILNENGTKTYKFKYTTGLMYGINSNIKMWDNNYINPIEYQNDFIENTTNIENVFHRLTLKKKEIVSNTKDEVIVKYIYQNEADNIYAYTNNSLVNYIVINNKLYYKNDTDYNKYSMLTNKRIEKYNDYNEEYIINDFIDSDDVEVYVSFKKYLYEEIDIYTIDNDKFIKVYDKLKNNEVKLTSFKENIIKGKINLENSSSIYTSIAYDKGWKVYSNGKQLETYKINNSLLGFDLNAGNNVIELKYYPNNLDIGIAISITTLIGTITYLLINKKKSNHQD